ncbi:MAG: hypothetical protein CME32_08735 [Gimesia sp.]|nr:hypothetical protein [Gimesia sp.]
MAESDDKQNQTATYLVTLQGLNEFVTLDNLPAKFGLLCGGIGVKVLELEQVTAETRAHEVSKIAVGVIDAMEQLVLGAMDQAASEGAKDAQK